MSPYDINAMLQQNICEVVFIKSNGSERNMCCTKSNNILGPPTDTKTRTWDGDTLTVWDMEADSWRSFKASRVKSIKIID